MMTRIVNCLVAGLILAMTCSAGPATASGWLKVAPVRSFGDARQGVLGSDIQAMLPVGHIYTTPGESFVNWAHETTHGTNSRIRNLLPAGSNAFYVGRGYAFGLREPRTTLAAVAAQIPSGQRFGGFQLYLVDQQRYWQQQPLYVLDEWVSYTNGTLVGLEIGRPEAMTLTRTIEFSAYAEAVIRAARIHDPGYADAGKLREFVDWQNRRVAAIVKKATKAGALNREHGLILKASFRRP